VVLEEGVRLDPLSGQIRLQLEAATQGVLRDLVEGVSSACALCYAAFSKTDDKHAWYNAHAARESWLSGLLQL
jgi:hypothetical protein